MPDSIAEATTKTLEFRLPRSSRSDELPDELPLDLIVRDRDVIETLCEREAGSDREQFALDALRIGVVALRHATGRLDADLLRRETSQLLSTLGQTLQGYTQTTRDQLNSSLKEYFDPKDGRFSERVQRLIAHDGELSQLVKDKITGENSELARTMLAHVGKESPLMKLLDPGQSQGLLAALRHAVDGQLSKQSEQVLKEFSLDNEEGALTRLVREITAKHGSLTKDLHTKIDDVVKEFSLDEENSALSRLVKNVDNAQKTISDEFSFNNDKSAFSQLKRMLDTTQTAVQRSLTLDDESSPLAKLKKELFDLLEGAEKKNTEFQQQVRVALGEMAAAKKEADRSTRHGEQFEDAVFEFIALEATPAGDIATPTGATTGRIKNCKVGDCVVELGPNCQAEGEKIVVEAKQRAGYDLAKARAELETARKNRDASLGLFVFSQRYAPTGIESLHNFGNDIICVWDPEDPSTDVYLKGALLTARGLSIRKSLSVEATQVDFGAIDEAVLEIEKRAANLSVIRKSAETIKAGSEKILGRLDIDEKAFEKQLAVLREKLDDVRAVVGCEE